MDQTLSATVQGRELIAQLADIDTCLAAWLAKLDDFDTWGTLAEDGHGSCVSWLVDRCGLARATAHDKLRVAKELAKHKVLGAAFANGGSYSKIRTITRIDWLYRHPAPVDESSVKTPEPATPVDKQSPRETPKAEPTPRPGIRARRVDALLDLLEHAAYEHRDRLTSNGRDRVTVDYDTLINAVPGAADLASGATIAGDAARRLACDAGLHRLIVKGASEILDAGCKSRYWNRAQRRAIAARHGHRCAIAGCERRIYEIHHIQWWENKGDTSVHNGVALCLTHHHYVHESGWTIAYDLAAGITTLTGPAGQTIRSCAARVPMPRRTKAPTDSPTLEFA